jgi:hypothetical protein
MVRFVLGECLPDNWRKWLAWANLAKKAASQQSEVLKM